MLSEVTSSPHNNCVLLYVQRTATAAAESCSTELVELAPLFQPLTRFVTHNKIIAVAWSVNFLWEKGVSISCFQSYFLLYQCWPRFICHGLWNALHRVHLSPLRMKNRIAVQLAMDHMVVESASIELAWKIIYRVVLTHMVHYVN
jgi:hypothetical protein